MRMSVAGKFSMISAPSLMLMNIPALSSRTSESIRFSCTKGTTAMRVCRSLIEVLATLILVSSVFNPFGCLATCIKHINSLFPDSSSSPLVSTHRDCVLLQTLRLYLIFQPEQLLPPSHPPTTPMYTTSREDLLALNSRKLSEEHRNINTNRKIFFYQFIFIQQLSFVQL